MANGGFGKGEEPEFGTKTAKPGEWYGYSLYSDQTVHFGRFRNRDKDDPVLYFDIAPAQTWDSKGELWVIKEGEISVPLSHLKTFFPATIDAANMSINEMNWHRAYLDDWVIILNHGVPPAIGNVAKSYPTAFHLRPYVSDMTRAIVDKAGKEKIVALTHGGSIETIAQDLSDKMIQAYFKDRLN
jgi:hypothetical protein